MIDYIEKNAQQRWERQIYTVSNLDPIMKKFDSCAYSNSIKKIFLKVDSQDAAKDLVALLEGLKISNQDIPIYY